MPVTTHRASLIVALALAIVSACSIEAAAPANPQGDGDGASRPAAAGVPSDQSAAPSTPSAGSPSPRATASPSATDSGATDAGATASPGATSRPARPFSTATDLQPGSVNRTSIYLRATYSVGVTLRYGSGYLGLSSRMTVVNTSGGPIDRLELNTIAARLGNLRIREAAVDGRPVRVTIDDQTLVVPLGGVLPAGGSVQVLLRTGSTLRSGLTGSSWMYTRVNGIIDAYRWLPWISRRIAFNRPNHGDPFMTPISPQVTVKITTDRPMTIATSGDRTSVSGLTQTFVARNVRDFTITASPYYRTLTGYVGNTIVRVYHRTGAPASSMLAAARHAISRYESLLASSYPYRYFKVVQSAGGYGMESPGLIWIPRGASNLGYLVHHETAHQWFYGLVGSNQAREPYTDEAAADFIARYALGLRRGSRCSTARLDLSIYQYSSACYYEVVYIQGGNFLDDLRRRMGSTAFWKGLRAYVAANRYKLAATKTLLDTLDAATSLDLVPRYRARFPRIY